MRPRALKDLTKEHLHMEIQTGEHDPVSIMGSCDCAEEPIAYVYIVVFL